MSKILQLLIIILLISCSQKNGKTDKKRLTPKSIQFCGNIFNTNEINKTSELDNILTLEFDNKEKIQITCIDFEKEHELVTNDFIEILISLNSLEDIEYKKISNVKKIEMYKISRGKGRFDEFVGIKMIGNNKYQVYTFNEKVETPSLAVGLLSKILF